MAGVLTEGRSGAALRDTAGALIGMRRSLVRNAPGGSGTVVMFLLISGLNLVVPALAFHAPALLPWVGLSTALIASTGAANVYGEDGTALWLTRMVPGVERADVRGRQVAWLLVVGPATVVLTVALTALGGQGRAWSWALAMLPVALGATPGLQLPVAAGFIVVGLAAIWWAETIRRRPAWQPEA